MSDIESAQAALAEWFNSGVRKEIAKAICEADPIAPRPDAIIYSQGKPQEAWESRLPMADAAIRVILGGS